METDKLFKLIEGEEVNGRGKVKIVNTETKEVVDSYDYYNQVQKVFAIARTSSKTDALNRANEFIGIEDDVSLNNLVPLGVALVRYYRELPEELSNNVLTHLFYTFGLIEFKIGSKRGFEFTEIAKTI